MNKVILVGHVGRTPKVRHTRNDIPVVTFPLATTTSWHDEHGNKRERLEWQLVIAWGEPAEVCKQSLVKGTLVYIEGALRTWDDEEDGITRYRFEVIAQRIELPGNRYQDEEPPAYYDDLS